MKHKLNEGERTSVPVRPKSLRIADIQLDNPVILAPMAGVCNPAFRRIAKRLGAGMVCAEMVSDKALVYRNERTWNMLQVVPDEHPVSMQIVGYDIETMVLAAEMVEEGSNADIIDINMGCPVLKIHKNGSGAALARDPAYAAAIVDAVVKRVNRPVTVKFRKGWDDQHVNAVEVAKAVEAAGAQAVAVHGRTARQMYGGQADWSVIHQVKQAVSIPVIGNGDVTNPQRAERLMRETGCDGVMVGRAALGNPWIFREIVHFLEMGALLPSPTYKERIEVAVEHLRMLVEDKGEYIGVREMRKHAGWYVKGMPGAADLRNLINEQETEEGMIVLLRSFLERLDE